MSVIPLRNNNYGFPTPLSAYPPFPIISQRAPTTHDFAQIGTPWIYVPGNSVYFLSSIVSNVANWVSVSGGSGSFSSLTVTPGPISLTGITNINTSGSAVTNIGTGTYTGTVTIGNAANATQVTVIAPIVDIDSSANGLIEIGTSVTTGTVGIGTSLTTGTLNIGNHASTNTVQAEAGTGGWKFITGGLVSWDFVQATEASPTATAVINARQCYANFTGFTTAAAGKQVFIITNSLITANSSLLVTAMNLGANDAEMTVTRVLPGAGTVSITLTNNGAAALNGDVNITLFVCD